jgi:hypothetical protein
LVPAAFVGLPPVVLNGTEVSLGERVVNDEKDEEEVAARAEVPEDDDRFCDDHDSTERPEEDEVADVEELWVREDDEEAGTRPLVDEE